MAGYRDAADMARRREVALGHLSRFSDLVGGLRAATWRRGCARSGRESLDEVAASAVRELEGDPEGARRVGEARAEWLAATGIWWEMASSTERIASREARRLESSARRLGLELHDLEVAGLIGAYRAAQKWDPAMGASWATYAASGIRGYMRNSLREARLSGGRSEGVQISQAMTHLARYGPVSVRSAAAWLGVDPEKAATRAASEHVVRLDCSRSEDGDSSLLDVLADDFEDPVTRLDRDRVSARVREAVSRLDDRTRRVIEGRLAGLTLAEIGDELGVSRERVRQLQGAAEGQLRRALRSLATPAERACWDSVPVSSGDQSPMKSLQDG